MQRERRGSQSIKIFIYESWYHSRYATIKNTFAKSTYIGLEWNRWKTMQYNWIFSFWKFLIYHSSRCLALSQNCNINYDMLFSLFLLQFCSWFYSLFQVTQPFPNPWHTWDYPRHTIILPQEYPRQTSRLPSALPPTSPPNCSMYTDPVSSSDIKSNVR